MLAYFPPNFKGLKFKIQPSFDVYYLLAEGPGVARGKKILKKNIGKKKFGKKILNLRGCF